MGPGSLVDAWTARGDFGCRGGVEPVEIQKGGVSSVNGQCACLLFDRYAPDQGAFLRTWRRELPTAPEKDAMRMINKPAVHYATIFELSRSTQTQ